MRQILVATDFSERSERALGRGAMLARAGGWRMDLVHVVDDDRPRRLVDHEMGEATVLLDERRAAEGLAGQARVLAGDPFTGIAQAAEDAGADLLVIGAHRRRAITDAFAGTTAERTIRAVRRPVLMVHAAPIAPYRQILLTSDLSQPSLAALRGYQALGIGQGAGLSLLHVFEVPALRLAMSATMSPAARRDYLDSRNREAAGDLARFAEGLGGLRAAPVLRPEIATPAQEILAAAGQRGADLLVLATQGRGALARMVLGSVTEQVLRTAALDVLAIPPPQG